MTADKQQPPADGGVPTLPCVRCGKPATLQCPKCLELKLERDLAAYCSQDCFKVCERVERAGHTAQGLRGCFTRSCRLVGQALRLPHGGQGALRALPSLCAALVTDLRAPAWPPAPALQEAWGEHKKLHKPGLDGWHYCTRRGQGRSLNMPDFKWTGTLRPARIGPPRPVRWAGGWLACFGWEALTGLCGKEAAVGQGRRLGPREAEPTLPLELVAHHSPTLLCLSVSADPRPHPQARLLHHRHPHLGD